jgi:ubiquinone/menaquinone biosynthesis C-methylase UbiE
VRGRDIVGRPAAALHSMAPFRQGEAMTDTADAIAADQALKARHAAMWAWGDYPAIARDMVRPMSVTLVEAARVRPGQRVLDVATGTGNAAILAAKAGADVVANDLAPELLEEGRRIAEKEGVSLQWREADAEHLPFDDAEFDTTLSCIGVMFAPYHEKSAGELARVTKPGGLIALASWTPQGFIGQMFATMKPYAPPSPPGAQPPPRWGDEEHVAALFGDRVDEVSAAKHQLSVEMFGNPDEFRDYFKSSYGPTIATYKTIADDPEKVASLDRDLSDLAARHLDDSRMSWEYLVVTARRRG